MQCVPFESIALDAYPQKSAWEATAAELVATMLDRWHLTVEDAYVGGSGGSVLRVHKKDGSPAVLKVGFPHFEGLWEAVGLELMAPVAPQVLRQDPWTWSLLLELVEPGTQLHSVPMQPDEALDVAAGVLARIHQTAAPDGVLTLESVIDAYASSARDRFDEQRVDLERLGVRQLVERAVDDSIKLAASGPQHPLLHGDFNPGNVLSSGEGGWMVVDPKPMTGDSAFDPAPLIAQIGDPWTASDPADVLRSRFERFCLATGIDAPRAMHWAFVRAGYDVTWYLEDGNAPAAESSASRLTVLTRLL